MRMKTPCCALVMLGLALAGSAQAQWKWLDATGQVNYSDHPPPLSVPSGRILSQGGSLRAALAAPAAAAASGDAATGAGNDSPQAGAPDAAAATQSAASPAIQAGSSATADAAPADKADGGPARPRTPAERLNALRKQQALKEAAQREAEQKKQAQAGGLCLSLCACPFSAPRPAPLVARLGGAAMRHPALPRHLGIGGQRAEQFDPVAIAQRLLERAAPSMHRDR